MKYITNATNIVLQEKQRIKKHTQDMVLEVCHRQRIQEKFV